MTTLKDAKEKFKEEWLAFLVKKETPELAGDVLDHDRDKHALHKRLREKKVKYAYITYAGSYIKPGYEVLFSHNQQESQYGNSKWCYRSSSS